MSNPDQPADVKEAGSLKSFEKSRNTALALSLIFFGMFLIAVFYTSPLFFTNPWLIPIIGLLLVTTRWYGAAEAYMKMRKQTDRMQEDLDNISKAVEKVREK